jgi:hypothetical protein
LKVFYLHRLEDESGISGTGRIAQGFVADNGRVALFWLSEHPSVNLYDSIGDIQTIHGHEGKTEMRFEPDYKRAFNEVTSALDTLTLPELVASRLPPEGAASKILKPLVEDQKADPPTDLA